jgi:hypothetical protein
MSTAGYMTGRARSTDGQPFTLNTYKMDDHGRTDRNTLTIWNDDESAVLVHEAEAYITETFVWYVDPTSHERRKLMLGHRELSIAYLYLHRLERENRQQMQPRY